MIERSYSIEGQPMGSVSPDRPDHQRVPARRGVAAHVKHGQVVKVINTSGKQVVDTWAFNAPMRISRLRSQEVCDESCRLHCNIAVMAVIRAVVSVRSRATRRPLV